MMILLDAEMEQQDSGFQLVLMHLQRDLEAQGHVCRFAGKSQIEMNHDAARIARYVEGQAADAWVVVGGMEETLSWFLERPVPAIAIGGRCREIPIASTGWDTLGAFREACHHLTGMGHRRIVFVSSREMRHPRPSRHLEALAEELEACGAAAGPYNTPEWDETPEGLMELLESAFRFTPPTAILVENANWLLGVLGFLALRGLRVPRDLSLVCLYWDPSFRWWRPAIAHLGGDDFQMAARVVRWVEQTAEGQADNACVPCQAEFVPGESIAPAPG